MAIPISDLTQLTTPADGDLLAIVDVDANSTKKITRQDLFKSPPLANNSVTAAMLATNAITLGYEEITSNFVTNSTGDTDVTGLSVTVTIPAGGRRCKIETYVSHLTASGGGNATELSIKEGATTLVRSRANNPVTASSAIVPPSYSAVLSAGAHTYKVTMKNDISSNTELVASATSPAYILVTVI